MFYCSRGLAGCFVPDLTFLSTVSIFCARAATVSVTFKDKKHVGSTAALEQLWVSRWVVLFFSEVFEAVVYKAVWSLGFRATRFTGLLVYTYRTSL